MKSSRYLLEIIIYPSINFIIPSIVPSMQEFFLSLLSIGGGDSDGSAFWIPIYCGGCCVAKNWNIFLPTFVVVYIAKRVDKCVK